MLPLLQQLCLVVSSLSMLAFCIYAKHYGADSVSVSMVSAAVVFLLVYLWLYRRMLCVDKENRLPETIRLGTPVHLKLNLSYGVLVARMMALAEVDEKALVYDAYLAWSTRTAADIRIRKEGNSDWVALFWVNTQEDKPMRGHGVVVYRNGCLSLYPAAYRQAFEDAFMLNIFLPTQKEFAAWLAKHGVNF